jgi:hypothetical protein
MWDMSLGFEKPNGLENFFYNGKPICQASDNCHSGLMHLEKERPPKRAPLSLIAS